MAEEIRNYKTEDTIALGAEAVILGGYSSNGDRYCVKEIKKWPRRHNTKNAEYHELRQKIPYDKKRKHLLNEWSIQGEIWNRLTSKYKNPENMPVVQFHKFQEKRFLGIETGCDLLMEYIPGNDLGDERLIKSIPPEKKLNYLLQTAETINNIHNAGYLHLDIKPANVMVSEGKVKVIDFGMSAYKGHRRYFVRGGTEQYQPPEQFVLDQVMDERSDVFAFGVTVNVLFNGKPITRRNFEEEIKNQRLDYVNSKTSGVDTRTLNFPDAKLEELVKICTKTGINNRPGSFDYIIDVLKTVEHQNSS